jgi:hypothetical protein
MIAPITRWLPAFLLAFFTVAVAHAQKPKPKPTAKSDAETNAEYHSAEIGWKAITPTTADWKRMSNKEKAALNQKGRNAIEKATGETLDASNLKELLNLKKDQFNSFLSTIEPYDEKKDGSYADRQKDVQKMIFDAYATAGLKTSPIRPGKTTIDGLEFLTLEIDIMHPKNEKEVLINQKMFCRQINGYDFAMTVSTNNPQDRKVLEDLVQGSKFFIRK